MNNYRVFAQINIINIGTVHMPNKKTSNVPAHWESNPAEPFHVLGAFRDEQQTTVRVFSPSTKSVEIVDINAQMQRINNSDYFIWQGETDLSDKHYQLNITYDNGDSYSYIDPYSFGRVIDNYDLFLFSQGNHWHIYEHLGANKKTVDGIEGILFAVWAPNAQRISVIGHFNNWDGRRHPMQRLDHSGVWELFIPNLPAGELYKFEILDNYGNLLEKIDPYGKQFEMRPGNSSITVLDKQHQWQDQKWIETRAKNNWLHSPMSVYEVHLGSWKRDENHYFLNYRELAHQLVEYLKPLGFTHIELLPITEHPLDASWGYQTLGYFAPSSRFGTPDDFRYFVDYCHQHDIGVLLDWVPAHFPTDSHGLARFDGTALYEHQDPRQGEHRDWGTYIYNYGRNEVKNFLIASALFWLEEYHIDGLRVDAVASMLYLDYSRSENDWIPNVFGGNENLEAIEFIKHLNSVTQQQHPGVLMIAEESTSWPAVSHPTWENGLGFSMKWNMGWMNDTLHYFEKEPIHRKHHHDNLTFGLMYSFSENFMLPLSHDEVVHGKRSLLEKMPGDDWQRFANLRLLYTFMFAYPGKKLLFMGAELAQFTEWNCDTSLPWELLENDSNSGMHKLLGDLNKTYRQYPEMHFFDFESQGFEWIDCNDGQHSVISFVRKQHSQFIVVVLNFTPVPRENYRIGVPQAGHYYEIFNSDSSYYGGSNFKTKMDIQSENKPYMNRPCSINIDIPPLAGLIYTFNEN